MKKLIFILSFFLSLEGVLATGVPPVFHGGVLPGPAFNTGGRVDTTTGLVKNASGQEYVVKKLIPGVTNGFLMTFLAICVGTIIIAGVYFVFSSGESEMKQKAKDIIFWTATGATIAILAVAIVRFIIGINFSG